MKEHRKDDERLSALLQGQLSGPERDELLAHLAASDDDYEVFNDAVEILGALEEQDARTAAAEEPAAVIPM
ncbi:MAG TPA: zf-HC2 domain-containing protein, partial [Longimicrobium sp.]|nr:zf-HC2 domain-containing protein [Longimicrobium sp.]